MAPVANKTSAAARRRNSKDQSASNRHNERNEQDLDREQDLGREQDLAGDRDEHDSRDDQRGEQGWRHERNGRSGSVQRSVRSESDSDQRERSPDWSTQAAANPFEAFTPTFDVPKMFTTMFELTAGIAKLQQEAFISMFATTTDTDTDGDHRDRDHRDHDDRDHDDVSASRTR